MGACKKYRKGPDFYKLYDLLQQKSDLADSIMDKNNVYDMDGSDNMADYLKVSASIDSIYKANKWKFLHLTSCSMGDLSAH